MNLKRAFDALDTQRTGEIPLEKLLKEIPTFEKLALFSKVIRGSKFRI